MQSGLQLCIRRFKARLNWRWLSKARDSYGFMSCVAQMLILCRYTQCMVLLEIFMQPVQGYLCMMVLLQGVGCKTYVLCVCRFSLFLKALNSRCIM